jgi:hypothetical protein
MGEDADLSDDMPISDEDGITRAYRSPNNIHVSGHTMYIAGTHTAGDVLTDLTIPLHVLTSTPRYRQAQEALTAHPEVDHIVGHSLGGAIGTELVKSNEGLTGVMYGSPNIQPHPRITYRRHYFDPISFANVGAEETPAMYPHSYRGWTMPVERPEMVVGRVRSRTRSSYPFPFPGFGNPNLYLYGATQPPW